LAQRRRAICRLPPLPLLSPFILRAASRRCCCSRRPERRQAVTAATHHAEPLSPLVAISFPPLPLSLLPPPRLVVAVGAIGVVATAYRHHLDASPPLLAAAAISPFSSPPLSQPTRCPCCPCYHHRRCHPPWRQN
jgi:hypothetical protein